ncbi:MAG: HpcH/HpaI aldolase/citrate lyase family protein [Chloroflexi bacterium]|nr:HpcH/HpaI aldolase/citrate lyase family protein [Chloroflexota bacterium]
MKIPKNKFKAALANGSVQIGLWSTLGSNIVAEVIGDSGFDWILLDTEHSPNELPGLVSQMQGMATGTASPIVRPAWNDPVLIKRLLDIGAQTLLLPFVQNGAEAKAAVAATRYPPDGIRGVTGSGRAARYGRVKTYLHEAANEIAVLVQIETGSGLENLEEIATVPGVDGVFIGPSDLSASLGHLGNPKHETVQAALKTAVTQLKSIGIAAGILAFNPEDARRYIEWGYQFIAVGSDLSVLASGTQALAASFKNK